MAHLMFKQPIFHHVGIEIYALIDDHTQPIKIGQTKVTNFSREYLKLYSYLISDDCKRCVHESINKFLSPLCSVNSPECFYYMPRLKTLPRRKRDRLTKSHFLPGVKITSLFKGFSLSDVTVTPLRKGETGYISTENVALIVFKMATPNPEGVGRTINLILEESFSPLLTNLDGQLVIATPPFIEPDSFHDFASFSQALTANSKLRDNTGITSIVYDYSNHQQYLQNYHPLNFTATSVKFLTTPLNHGFLSPKKDSKINFSPLRPKKRARKPKSISSEDLDSNKELEVKEQPSSTPYTHISFTAPTSSLTQERSQDAITPSQFSFLHPLPPTLPSLNFINPPLNELSSVTSGSQTSVATQVTEDLDLANLPAPEWIDQYISSRSSKTFESEADQAFLQTLNVNDLINTKQYFISRLHFHLQQMEIHLPPYKSHHSSYEKCLSMIAALSVIIAKRQETPSSLFATPSLTQPPASTTATLSATSFTLPPTTSTTSSDVTLAPSPAHTSSVRPNPILNLLPMDTTPTSSAPPNVNRSDITPSDSQQPNKVLPNFDTNQQDQKDNLINPIDICDSS